MRTGKNNAMIVTGISKVNPEYGQPEAKGLSAFLFFLILLLQKKRSMNGLKKHMEV